MTRSRNKNKKNEETQQEEEKDDSGPATTNTTDTCNMDAIQASLESISGQLNQQHKRFDEQHKQFETLRKDIKDELRLFREDIVLQVEGKLADFKADIARQFAEISEDLKGQRESMNGALLRTEEVERWSVEANATMKELLSERDRMIDKLEDLESRSRRSNLRLYNFPEEAEAQSESMIQFIDTWLRKEILDTDLSIQRAHRALAPKRANGQPPRSIVINFLRFDVKEKVLSKAWEKKVVNFGEHRIYFDHDHTDKVLKIRRSYGEIKRALNKATPRIQFKTPYTRMRIHWPNEGWETYYTAEEAADAARRRGLTLGGDEAAPGAREEGGEAGERAPTLTEGLRQARLTGWAQVTRGRGRTAANEAKRTGRSRGGRMQTQDR